MKRTISDEARQLLAHFESETDATIRDCIVDETHDQVIFLVEAGDMSAAIGPGGKHVQQVQDDLGKRIKLVEDADTAEAFVANALAPAAVYHVTISENDDVVAYAEVEQSDTGAAIGVDGRNIDAARTLAKRHFDVDDVELT
ncbi:NusA-like transcription termination signal-binding factor [Haloarculaceae archaeon H-GB2-1]|nr:NusA-like transcription termination signal-binding factor [Haloarculaceae archaeon H-GB1-1]MEA5388280.1 NusA-like transcription termination signal-binding factor [Haloarculaceae archaeon H-GB11]MEA5406322.1 NusA-like transcription termination signal-binding factor [Haloarculaceae archaeon H-GB2-1]